MLKLNRHGLNQCIAMHTIFYIFPCRKISYNFHTECAMSWCWLYHYKITGFWSHLLSNKIHSFLNRYRYITRIDHKSKYTSNKVSLSFLHVNSDVVLLFKKYIFIVDYWWLRLWELDFHIHTYNLPHQLISNDTNFNLTNKILHSRKTVMSQKV